MFGNLDRAKKRAGVVGGIHNRMPPAARRAGENGRKSQPPKPFKHSPITVQAMIEHKKIKRSNVAHRFCSGKRSVPRA